MTSFSLKTLSKVLLNREYEDTYSAHDRARITYEVLKHLCAGDSTNDNENISVNLEPLLSSTATEAQEAHFKNFDLMCATCAAYQGQESLEEFVFTVLYDEPKRDAREVLDIIVTYFKNQDKVVNKSPPEENASQCKSEEENKTDKAVNDLTGQMDLLSTEENKP
ncbi:hypothetical protein AAG570_007985 [Ranatra chinensis]|uniref:Uncharacterized protein n=1 Tax=Ranatra chinensis TaxID=642074 RepID=A0ABD0XTG8_9HEMI